MPPIRSARFQGGPARASPRPVPRVLIFGFDVARLPLGRRGSRSSSEGPAAIRVSLSPSTRGSRNPGRENRANPPRPAPRWRRRHGPTRHRSAPAAARMASSERSVGAPSARRRSVVARSTISAVATERLRLWVRPCIGMPKRTSAAAIASARQPVVLVADHDRRRAREVEIVERDGRARDGGVEGEPGGAQAGQRRGQRLVADDVQPLLAPLGDGARVAKRLVDLDHLDALNAERLGAAQHRGAVVRVVQVLDHHPQRRRGGWRRPRRCARAARRGAAAPARRRRALARARSNASRCQTASAEANTRSRGVRAPTDLGHRPREARRPPAPRQGRDHHGGQRRQPEGNRRVCQDRHRPPNASGRPPSAAAAVATRRRLPQRSRRVCASSAT